MSFTFRASVHRLHNVPQEASRCTGVPQAVQRRSADAGYACTDVPNQAVLGRLSLELGRFSLDLVGFWVGVVRVWFHIRGVSFMRTRVGARFAQKTKENNLL